MIDPDGFRHNVGVVLVNAEGNVFWGRRYRQSDVWQFPQGGIKTGEQPQQALFRELYEELGLRERDVTIVAESPGPHYYRFPPPMVKVEDQEPYIGQKQHYFMLRLNKEPASFNFESTDTPEFSQFRWVSYWYPLQAATAFKQAVYRQVLCDFRRYLQGIVTDVGSTSSHHSRN